MKFRCTGSSRTLVLLGSSWADAPANPADGNLARVDYMGNVYSINADLAMASNLFHVCTNPPAGCSNAQQGCVSAAELAGTGFDVEDTFSMCTQKPTFGAATGWLTTSGNVVPGEEITLRIAVWDAGHGLARAGRRVPVVTRHDHAGDDGAVVGAPGFNVDVPEEKGTCRILVHYDTGMPMTTHTMVDIYCCNDEATVRAHRGQLQHELRRRAGHRVPDRRQGSRGGSLRSRRAVVPGRLRNGGAGRGAIVAAPAVR